MDKERILSQMSTRSSWARGVRATAADLLDRMIEEGIETPTEGDLLNGASCWSEWVHGGCGLVYDEDIAERYCSPSELERKRHGALRPNQGEDWMDVEARAASQAARKILKLASR